MIKILLQADKESSYRDIDVSEESTNLEKAMLLAQLRIVEIALLESMNDDWQVQL